MCGGGRDHPGPKNPRESLQKVFPVFTVLRMFNPEDSQNITAFFDAENPMSLTSLLPEKYGKPLRKLVCSLPCCHEFLLDEPALRKHMYDNHKYRPTVADNRIRYAFWLEYENSINDGRVMDLKKVSTFVMTHAVFERMYLNLHAPRSVWLIVRPAHYEHALEEMLIHGVTRMREILDMPILDEKNKPNMKMLELQVKITNMADYRLHGAPKQNIQQLNVNLNKDIHGEAGRDIKELVQKGDMNAIQKRLRAIALEKQQLEGRVIEDQRPQEHEVLEAVPVERKES